VSRSHHFPLLSVHVANTSTFVSFYDDSNILLHLYKESIATSTRYHKRHVRIIHHFFLCPLLTLRSYLPTTIATDYYVCVCCIHHVHNHSHVQSSSYTTPHPKTDYKTAHDTFFCLLLNTKFAHTVRFPIFVINLSQQACNHATSTKFLFGLSPKLCHIHTHSYTPLCPSHFNVSLCTINSRIRACFITRTLNLAR